MKVLVVDDDPDLRALATIALEQIGGFDVETAKSGLDVLERVARGECWNLALLDVMMPGLDGPGTLARLREQNVDLPVVFFTARVQPSDLSSYKAMGALGTISKPFDPMTLASDLRRLVEDL